MRMKPLPKALIILVVVGGVGYGVSTYFDYRKANTPAPLIEVTIPPIPPTPTVFDDPAAKAAAAVSAAKAAAGAQPSQDRGLTNLLGK